MRRDFPEICKTFATDSVKQTLLTNGLLLEKRYDDVYHYLAEIIVSLDGADALTHNKIRGLESFDQILKGIRLATSMKEGPQVSIRTVLQKENFHQVVEIVHLAKLLGVNRISFLTADVLSEGFGRDTRGSVAPNEGIVLSEQETVRFRELVETAITEFRAEFQSRFISQSPAKMLHLVEYYEALIGRRPFPRNICNAPMVSAVITATGDLQPCFFLPTYGNVRRTPIRELIDSSALRAVRRNVTAYSLERCHKCVCTLYVRPTDALFDRF
jgi:MoaA/NifB/PqqE/SkfB family radical SAM enzyme